MSTEVVARAELDDQGGALVREAHAIEVVDPASFARAGEMLQTIKAYLRRVADVFGPIVEAAHRAHKTAVEQRKGLEAHALQAEGVLKRRLAVYEQEQERLRRAAEEAARRERERLEAEERARVAAEEARLRREAEEAQLAAAVAAEQAGDTETAERLVAAPVVAPPVAPRQVFVPPAAAMVPPRPQADGVSFRDQYRAEVVSLLELVRAVAAGRAPLTLVQANQVALNGMARSLRGAMDVPGVRVVTERIAAVRPA